MPGAANRQTKNLRELNQRFISNVICDKAATLLYYAVPDPLLQYRSEGHIGDQHSKIHQVIVYATPPALPAAVDRAAASREADARAMAIWRALNR